MKREAGYSHGIGREVPVSYWQDVLLLSNAMAGILSYPSALHQMAQKGYVSMVISPAASAVRDHVK